MGCQQAGLIHNTFDSAGKENIDIGQFSPLKLISSQLSGREIILINNILQKHILFYKLTISQRIKLISSMQKFKAKKNNYIFKEHDQPDYAFIVDSGTVQIQIEISGKKTRKTLREGSIFGDLALLNTAKRSASAYAQTDCNLIALSKDNFHSKMEELARESHSLVFDYIDNAPVFRKLTLSQKKSIASHMNEVKFEKDTNVFQAGDYANCIYLIKKGEIQIRFQNRSSLVLTSGDIFGQSGLRMYARRGGQARAISTSECFVISRNKLILCVETNDIKDISNYCIIRWGLKRNEKYTKITSEQITKIIQSGLFMEVEDNFYIVTAGERLTKLIICLEGEMQFQDLLKSKNTKEQKFSIGSMLNQDYESDYKSPFSVIKKQKGNLFTIEHAVLLQILHPKSLKRSISHNYQIDNFLRSLNLIKKIQCTQIASRYLVTEGKTRYIVHVFGKLQMIQYKRQNYLLNDKEINQTLSNRNIINIIRTLKDERNLYFVYKQYQDFTLDHLLKKVNFPKDQTIDFLIMNLINMLQFLHSSNILLRSLKPQNIILQNGYPHLLSFMLAKKMKEESTKTFTIIGSPHYLAPEVHQGLGYSFSSDYWSLGVLLFQLTFGYLPFGYDKEDPYSIFLSIQNGKLYFPHSFSNRKKKKFIELLLNRESWNRPDHSTIKKCDYFKGIDYNIWQQLKEGEILPPKQIDDALNEVREHFSDQIQDNFINYLQKQQKCHSNIKKESINSIWDQFF